MTRRSRRASSAPQRVGSEEGLTSSRPLLAQPDQPEQLHEPDRAAAGSADDRARASDCESDAPDVGARHTPRMPDQSTDDTDEGWGERGDDDASARWLRENRPPHWG